MYLKKLWLSRSSLALLIAAAFLSISDERQDDDEEFSESLRSFLMQMQLRSILCNLVLFEALWEVFELAATLQIFL